MKNNSGYLQAMAIVRELTAKWNLGLLLRYISVPALGFDLPELLKCFFIINPGSQTNKEKYSAFDGSIP